MKDKHIEFYMNLAKCAAQNNTACLSRQVASIIVNPTTNAVVSIGLNGIAKGLPHANSEEHLSMVWQDILDEEQRASFDEESQFISECIKCEKCPRQVLGYGSGEGLNICSCVHSEISAIANAAKTNSSTVGCWIFVEGPSVCNACASAIINAEINTVVWRKQDRDYSKQTRWMLDKANIQLIEWEGPS